MRIALAQLNYTIGDFEKNISKIKQAIAKAKEQQAELIIFSELSVCGYPPSDFLEFRHFIDKCNKGVEDIAALCQGITAIIGSPTINPQPEGKNLFNSAYVCSEGKVTSRVDKALLPNYDIFDEYRYFEPGRDFHCVEINNHRFAITVCEDLWNVEDDPMYVSCPMDVLIKEKPELIINISASPFDHTHIDQRHNILRRNALQYKLPVIYVNQIGGQTEIIFDGGSVAMNAQGETVHVMKYFEEDFSIIELSSLKEATNQPQNAKRSLKGEPEGTATTLSTNKGVEPNAQAPLHSTLNNRNKIERTHSALLLGIRDYFEKLGYKKVTLGLSGGIDSAVVLCLATEAVGKENVMPVLMPSQFSSFGSVTDSLALCKNLDVPHELIPIDHVYDEFLNTLKKQFKGLPFNVAEENLQARSRGVILMALANKFGYILLNTSNKSELAVGYGTLYGDLCGGLSVIGDVYKTEVFELANYLNRNSEIIPQAIIDKHPSAELRPGQKDSDSLPEYDVLDPILYQYIEQRKGPRELIDMGFEETLVRRILKLVNTNEYKRYQTPPILRVSPKGFGTGRRMPIVGKYLS